MTNTTTRTPTPYRIGSTPTTIVRSGPDGQTIVVAVTETLGATQSYGQMCADARLIAKACNAHESMRLALVMVADTIAFQFLEPQIQSMVMESLAAAEAA